MINPYERHQQAQELAQKARENAVHGYLVECDRLIIEGDRLAGVTMHVDSSFTQTETAIDMDGARGYWLAAMKALSAAKVAAIGLNLEDDNG